MKFAVLLTGMFACLAVGCTGDGAQSGGTPQPASTVITTQRVTDLLPPSLLFGAQYSWQSDAGNGYLVWRQSEGIRRWDIASADKDGAHGGLISIDADFDDRQSPKQRQSCRWAETVGSDDVYVACSDNGPFGPGLDALRQVFQSETHEVYIAGRGPSGGDARCYKLSDPGIAGGTLCLDAMSGIPVSIEILGRTPGTTAKFELTSTLASSALLHSPISRDSNAEVVHRVTIELPDFSAQGSTATPPE